MMTQRQLVVDTETTGLSHKAHRLIEIACVELVNRRLTGNDYHSYINPQRDIEAGAQAVHGLTQTFLSDKPLFADIAESLMAFINDAELIIHNAPFDLGFMNSELRRLKRSHPPLEKSCRVIDTLALARKKHPGQQNSLDALCSRYGIDRSHRTLHGARCDAELLAQVYLQMTSEQTLLFPSTPTAAAACSNTPPASSPHLHPPEDHPSQRPPLLVIKANDEECARHQDFMERLKSSD